ncbi:MAG: hypothetical protein IJ205_01200 [Bacteroidales bacterium]|nr:hypothetical protein [Bacteroidales bacterium]
MIKKLLFILSCVTLSLSLWASSPVERIFVSTDREVYIAGDMVWCSLFCLDGKGSLSSQNAVSYLELISSDGTVAEAKIGLLGGRGCGSFRIPVTVPTGMYRLVAYTASEANEEGTPWMSGSRILTVFNTTSTARVKDGVEIVDEKTYESFRREEPAGLGRLALNAPARVRKGEDVNLVVLNEGPMADLSLSVYHEDDIVPSPQDNTIESFLKSLPGSAEPVVTGSRPLEYDGEIIHARMRGEMMDTLDYAVATLSSAGSPSNLYIGVTSNDEVFFHTNNIYGDREIVCEVSRLDKKSGVIEIENPFLYPSAGDLPKLLLSKSQRESLSFRKKTLRDEKTLMLDTLATFLRHREDLLLESSPLKHYHLDDYTRFSSVREILVEIIPSLALRRDKGRYYMTMMASDATDSYKARVGNLLVMMDGVVLSDLNSLLDFDAMLLEDIDIYQQAIVCGRAAYSGVVNFITKKNYVTALTFPANVRVVDFKGVSYPVAYLGDVPEGAADTRQVLYWHPALSLEKGGQVRTVLHAPSYSGRFRIVAEGLSEDGIPIHQERIFEVE